MPRHRPPGELWDTLRVKVWERDKGCCTHCGNPVSLQEFHLDHIRSGKLGDNAICRLRVLCRRCHVLRADNRHRGMIAAALRDGLIPPDWRPLVWDDE